MALNSRWAHNLPSPWTGSANNQPFPSIFPLCAHRRCFAPRPEGRTSYPESLTYRVSAGPVLWSLLLLFRLVVYSSSSYSATINIFGSPLPLFFSARVKSVPLICASSDVDFTRPPLTLSFIVGIRINVCKLLLKSLSLCAKEIVAYAPSAPALI